MVHPKKVFNTLKAGGVSFFTGVPDSLLKNFLYYLEENLDEKNHIIAANEGGAVSLAAGHYLSTGEVGCVYMQNSGLGNALNPLISLVDKEVYSIPMLLFIGWRGEPNNIDEPQHVKQGKVTEALLDVLSIPYTTLSPNMSEKDVLSEVSRLLKLAHTQERPCAILVKKGVFEAHTIKLEDRVYSLGREEAIEAVLDSLDGDEIIVSTTGKISRELYELRKKRKESHEKDFLIVGSMGHASQIALGIAHNKKNVQVYCLDGDGSFIMHMGSLAIVGKVAPKNFKHIVLNNGAHESVGGQPTAADILDMPAIARSSGYLFSSSVDTKEDFVRLLNTIKSKEGPTFLEAKINLGSRADLGRPQETPVDSKKRFMKSI